MLEVGGILKVKGSEDRLGYAIPVADWKIVALDLIEGQRMYAAVARGQTAGGRTLWVAGRVDAVGRPGHPPSPMQGSDALVWGTELGALEDHAERLTDDSW